MVFRWRPRSKPPSNVIPFPVDRTKKGLPSLIPTEPTPPVDLGQKKKEIKKKEQREQLLDWLAPPEVPTKEEGLSALGEERQRRDEGETDYQRAVKDETEFLDSIFGSITEQIKPKGVSKQKWITEIENYGLDLEEIKSIVRYNIERRWDKDTEPRALSKKEWIEELKDWEGMKDDPHEFLGPWFREWLESLQKDQVKKMSSIEKYYLEAVLKKIPEASPKKGIRSLVDENRLKQKLNKVGLGLPLEEGATDRQKYDKAVKQQQSKDLSHLDHFMITDVEFKINKLIEEMNVNKPTEELVYDLGTMLDYVDWDTDYKRSGRYEGPDKRRHDRYYSYGPPIANQKKKVSGGDAKLQKNIYNLVYKIKAEIEKRMRDE